jgi:2-iminobutanoate/2-iminopropanoate deaminase
MDIRYRQQGRGTSMSLDVIHTEAAASPLGHYSQAVICGDLIFLSGLLPIEPGEMPKPHATFETQVDCILRNAAIILRAAGSSLAGVVKSTAYLVDIKDWADFDRVYARHFGLHRPARAVVPVPFLHHGFAVEIEMIAEVNRAT